VLITHGVTSQTLRQMIIGDAALAGPGPGAGQGCVFHLRDGVQNVLGESTG